MQKPLLIYDGDCGFCVYSVRYWQKLTGNQVEYKPYQEAAASFPQISVAEFQRAVQYVGTDGRIASAAEASFLTLSHAPGNSLRLTLYRRLPGFAFISEKSYQLISTHRSFFYVLSKLCWGRNPEPPTYDLLTSLFLRGFALIFLAAFYSFATQSLGLIGSEGIIPVASLLASAKAVLGNWCYWEFPVVFWFNSSDLMVQLVCYGGMLFSVLLFFNVLPRLSLFVLYVLYLSLIDAGQVFMTFQWDLLLLETALISIILVRYRTLGIWLLRWLVFRFFFASALVKLASGDSSWWDLTALNYHFLTQPLPTPLAWYAYYLPPFVLKLATAMTLVIELLVPFLIFFPRYPRFFAGLMFFCLQTSILLTGNYNFFNFTAILLCLSLYDDAAIAWLIPRRLREVLRQRQLISAPWRITSLFAVIFTMVTVTLSFVQFNSRFLGYAPIFSGWANSLLAPLQIVNTYGPFAVMTKKRYEIIIEGSEDGRNWKEYAFKYKPGDVNRRPPWNIPFQPRVDWQLWFAALAPPEASPWFTLFMQRLLENSPAVTGLLAYNPFPDMPPVYVRALFFDYTYTTAEQYRETGAWWNRELVGVFYPVVSLK